MEEFAREGKKPYHKPTLLRVKLQPEEAVLTGCKGVSPGPGFNFCHGKGGWCRQKGS
jgi:hypothetical protein